MTAFPIERRPFARIPVSIVAAVVTALLAMTANRYGYHRDELYFRMLSSHPAWGYVDEPPLTPLLVRASTSVLGDSLWALRVPAILSAALTIVIVTLICRELGGGRSAQVITSIGVSSTFLLLAGHVLLTASPDMVFWTLAILFVVRALLRDEPRWWIWAGVTVGLSFYNKQLIILLLIGVLVGVLIAGPRRVLACRHLWIGAALAVVIATPTLVYQVANGFPELHMAHAISVDKGPDDRVDYVPFQIILMGPTLVPIWIAGFIGLFRDVAWQPIRALGWAYVVVSVLVLVSGGQVYYTFGLLALYVAAGAVRTERWIAHGGRIRPALVAAALFVTAVLCIPLALPVVPISNLASTGIPQLNQAARDSIGWPAYVGEVANAFSAIPVADRPATTLIVGNYGEAGALDRFGKPYGLPAVYSGQNQLYEYGPPPSSATAAIFLGYDPSALSADFTSCTQVGALDDNVGIDNEEQGVPILYCTGRSQPWTIIWPSLQHYS